MTSMQLKKIFEPPCEKIYNQKIAGMPMNTIQIDEVRNGMKLKPRIESTMTRYWEIITRS